MLWKAMSCKSGVLGNRFPVSVAILCLPVLLLLLLEDVRALSLVKSGRSAGSFDRKRIKPSLRESELSTRKRRQAGNDTGNELEDTIAEIEELLVLENEEDNSIFFRFLNCYCTSDTSFCIQNLTRPGRTLQFYENVKVTNGSASFTMNNCTDLNDWMLCEKTDDDLIASDISVCKSQITLPVKCRPSYSFQRTEVMGGLFRVLTSERKLEVTVCPEDMDTDKDKLVTESDGEMNSVPATINPNLSSSTDDDVPGPGVSMNTPESHGSAFTRDPESTSSSPTTQRNTPTVGFSEKDLETSSWTSNVSPKEVDNTTPVGHQHEMTPAEDSSDDLSDPWNRLFSFVSCYCQADMDFCIQNLTRPGFTYDRVTLTNGISSVIMDNCVLSSLHDWMLCQHAETSFIAKNLVTDCQQNNSNIIPMGCKPAYAFARFPYVPFAFLELRTTDTTYDTALCIGSFTIDKGTVSFHTDPEPATTREVGERTTTAATSSKTEMTTVNPTLPTTSFDIITNSDNRARFIMVGMGAAFVGFILGLALSGFFFWRHTKQSKKSKEGITLKQPPSYFWPNVAIPLAYSSKPTSGDLSYSDKDVF